VVALDRCCDLLVHANEKANNARLRAVKNRRLNVELAEHAEKSWEFSAGFAGSAFNGEFITALLASVARLMSR
jgi:hypothetical protein